MSETGDSKDTALCTLGLGPNLTALLHRALVPTTGPKNSNEAGYMYLIQFNSSGLIKSCQPHEVQHYTTLSNNMNVLFNDYLNVPIASVKDTHLVSNPLYVHN